MMLLRWLFFATPAGVVAGIFWLADQAGELRYRSDSDLVVAVREIPREFNPLLPAVADAATREIMEMLFDRPFRRDDELKLRAHLVQVWDVRQKVTFFFTSPENAEAAGAAIAGAPEKWKEWGLRDAAREEERIHATISGHSSGPPMKMGTVFQPEWPAQLLHVRLTVATTVSRSLMDFLSSAVEKEQVQVVKYDGDRVADLYLRGETDLFLKELRIYYESNPNLEPVIEVLGKASSVASLELELKLRPDARWHDGTPVTADDLAFSFREVTRPGSAWPQRESFDHVASVEKRDDFTLLVVLCRRFAPMLESWETLPVLPRHRLQDALNQEQWSAFFRRPVGTGPYRLESSGGEELILAANESYFLGVPEQPRIVYRRFRETRHRLAAMKLGQVEAFFPDESELVWGDGNDVVEWLRDAPRVQSFVVWNLERTQFADRRVREGLVRCVDLDRIRKETGKDRLRPWGGLFFPGIWYCPEGPGELPHDLSRAFALMREGGWKKPEAVWLDGDNGEVEFRLTFDSGNDLHSVLARELARAWERAGVRVLLDPMEWSAILERRLVPRDFEALVLGWELGFGRDRFGVWHSSRAAPGGGNLAGLKNRVVDELVAQMQVEEDEARIEDLARELQKQVFELQPFFFLGDSGRVMGLCRDRLREVRPREDGSRLIRVPAVERSGIYAGRPWWVRTDVLGPDRDTREPGDAETGGRGS